MEHATPAGALLIIVFIGPALYFIWRAARGAQLFIRRIPGIDALDDAIGRSVELGRPFSFTSGLSGIGPVLYACLGVLKYIAQKAATFGVHLIVPCQDPEVLVLSDATVQNAYREKNRFSSYDPTTLRFLSNNQFAFAAGYMGVMHREKVGSAFLFGEFAAESLILAEAGQQVGAVQVAATTSYAQVPFFLTSCDYTIIGEELYAAGALLSQDPVQTGSLRGQDFAKAFVMLLIIAGISIATWSAVKQSEFIPADSISLTRCMKAGWGEVSDCFSVTQPKDNEPEKGQ